MNRKTAFKSFSIAAAVVAFNVGSAHAAVELADGRLAIGGAVMQGWQGPIELEGSGVARPADEDAGSTFQRLRFALNVTAQITDNVSIFAELAEEPDDFNTDAGFDQFGIAQDLAWIQLDLGGGTLVRLGNIVTTTMTFLRYSDGAEVQTNPFIGNTPVDMITAEQGVWALGSIPLDGGHKITWDAGISTPDFLTDPTGQGDYNYQARGTFNFDWGLSFGAGVVRTTGDVTRSGGSISRDDGAPFNALIGLGDGDNYQFATRGPSNVNHVAIIPGIAATIWQADVQYKAGPFLAHGFYGQAKDEFSWADAGGGFRPLSSEFSDEDAEMSFWGVEGQYYILPNVYGAVRFTQSDNDTGSVASDEDELRRLQVAAGYWYADNVLVKIEYARQREEALSGGQNVNGTGSAEWDGVLLEASVSW